MILRKWENLPPEMRIPEVKEYYNLLSKKKFHLVLKRIFDVVVSSFLLVMRRDIEILFWSGKSCCSKGIEEIFGKERFEKKDIKKDGGVK